MNNNEVKFRHVRKNGNAITIAYKEVEDGKTIVAGARKSYKDQFCRKTGRAISEGRLNKAIKNGFNEHSENPAELFLQPNKPVVIQTEKLPDFINLLYNVCDVRAPYEACWPLARKEMKKEDDQMVWYFQSIIEQDKEVEKNLQNDVG